MATASMADRVAFGMRGMSAPDAPAITDAPASAVCPAAFPGSGRAITRPRRGMRIHLGPQNKTGFELWRTLRNRNLSGRRELSR